MSKIVIDNKSFKIENGYVSLDSSFGHMGLYLKHRQSKEYIELKKENGLYLLSKTISTLQKEKNMNGRWDLFLQKEEHYFRIFQEEKVVGQRSRYLYETEIAKDSYLLVYQALNKALSIYICSEKELLRERYNIKATVRSISKRRGTFVIKGKIDRGEFTQALLKKAELVNRNETDKTVELSIEENRSDVFSLNIPKQKGQFCYHYWDIYLHFEIEEKIVLVRIAVAGKYLIHKLKSRFVLEYESEKFLFYPYVTVTGYLAFCHREKSYLDHFSTFLKEKVAFLLAYLFTFHKHQNWILFEKNASSANDNAYAFYKYVKENYPEKKVWYVLKRDSPDWEKIEEQDILSYGSFRYFLELFKKGILISSESKLHVTDIRQQKGRLTEIIEKKAFIFLQHGVIGLKRIENIFNKKKSKVTKFTASTTIEKDILLSYFGYTENDVMLTGLARWDFLKNLPQERKKLLIIPTWRPWLENLSKDKFSQTDFFLEYSNLVRNISLQEKQMNIVFLLHPKFEKFTSLFDQINSENIQIKSFSTTDISSEISESSLLITDYSSICWDFLYLKKPVIFFQFDKKSYDLLQGSYSELNIELLGKRVSTVSAVLDEVSYYARMNFLLEPEYNKNRLKIIPDLKKPHCELIYEQIINLESEL